MFSLFPLSLEQCDENALRDAFSPFGHLAEVAIPRRRGKKLGFGFVQYTHHKDAKEVCKLCDYSDR